MADVFTSPDAIALLKDKSIVFMGDSNIRALYKDLLWLLSNNTLINNNCLRRKLERTYMGDKLVKSSVLTKSRDFFEERECKEYQSHLKFYFVTRCYCDIMINFLKEVREGSRAPPDVLIMNSCLWDITRWGPDGVNDYKDNMVKLMELLKISLPPKTLFIWVTALPISRTIRGGLIIKQISFMEKSLRFHIIEANLFTRNLVNSYGFDVVDFHYHLQFQISRRSCDGVHYLPLPVRLKTNLLLTHIALSWGRGLPNNGDFMFVEEEMDLALGKTLAQYKKECYNSILGQVNNGPSREPISQTKQALDQNPTSIDTVSINLPQPLLPNPVRAQPSSFKSTRSTRLTFNSQAVEDAGCVVREPLLYNPPAPWTPPPILRQQDSYFARHNFRQLDNQYQMFRQSVSEESFVQHNTPKRKARRRIKGKAQAAVAKMPQPCVQPTLQQQPPKHNHPPIQFQPAQQPTVQAIQAPVQANNQPNQVKKKNKNAKRSKRFYYNNFNQRKKKQAVNLNAKSNVIQGLVNSARK